MREALLAPDHENPLLSVVPQDALVLISQVGLRTTIAGLVEQFDASPRTRPPIDEAVLEALTGDLAIAACPQVRPGVPSGVLMIGTSDAPATEEAIRSQVDALVGKPRWQTTDHDGVEVSTSSTDRTRHRSRSASPSSMVLRSSGPRPRPCSR